MMLPLRVRTEYSFRTAFGFVENVAAMFGDESAAITDRNGTWGHVAWADAAKRPVFGVELAIVQDLKARDRRERICWCTFIAKNNAGLRELYELTSEATGNFYYVPRLGYASLTTSSDLIAIVGEYPIWEQVPNGGLCALSPASPVDTPTNARKRSLRLVACGNNFYPTIDDRAAYETIIHPERNPWPMHLLSEAEWLNIWPEYADAIPRGKAILNECDAKLPTGRLVQYKSKQTLREICEAAAKGRGISLKKKEYATRLTRELDLIAEKKFADYFFIVSDMIIWAKKRMLVGPARGSSAGSLVCYLLSITEIDPLKYDLLFERFIDVNRKDLPDIDVDFPDDKRELVLEYLRDKYGTDRVARIGTVSRYKAKSTIGDVSKALGIPLYEVTELKSVMIERSTGDARSQFCVADTFNELAVGKALMLKYPQMRIAEQIEGHARHSGQHAAGMLVTAEPVHRFCSVDERESVAMIDKHDAEKLNLLKIDCLGLRTLSILQDCLETVDWTFEKLYRYPTDDQAAFKILNDGKFAGIFQFEGQSLQSLAKEIPARSFLDVAAFTALARPGPLTSGGTYRFINRRLGKEESAPPHSSVAHLTNETHGIIIYQEQVMTIAREIGKLSWEDVSELRKAMSKSLGREFFDKFYERFAIGALQNGLSEKEAKALWENINTMGSWAFNKSHAVAYGLVSYWCCVLKARFPLEFAAATLRNAKDSEQVINLLRELVSEGYAYLAFDPELSEANWTVKEGKLIGGLTNVKGIGAKKASSLIAQRNAGHSLTSSLAGATTPFDDIHPTETLWGHIRRDPRAHGIVSPLLTAKQIDKNVKGTFAFIGRIVQKNIRDLNETIFLQKRNGARLTEKTKYLTFKFADDSDGILATISRWDFDRIGAKIYEEGAIGDWYLMRGRCHEGFRSIKIERIRKLTK